LSPNRAEIIKAILTNNTLSEDKKSEIIAEIMEEFQKTYPDLQYHATKADVKETELKLVKEIEDTRKEIKEVEAKLAKDIREVELKLTQEIENTRKEIKEVEAKLTKDIREVETKLTKEIKEVEAKLTKDIKELELKLTKDIKEVKFTTLKWQFIFWITQMGAILAIIYKLIR
jgi:DNA repair exonuclease SbcCD ATPase subunit